MQLTDLSWYQKQLLHTRCGVHVKSETAQTQGHHSKKKGGLLLPHSSYHHKCNIYFQQIQVPGTFLQKNKFSDHLGCKQKSTIKADYGAVNKSVSEYWIESWERERERCCYAQPAEGNSSAGQEGWNLICFYFFFFIIFIISLQFESDASWSEPAQHQKMCKSPMWQLLCPQVYFPEFHFSVISGFHCSSLTTNLPILYEHFLRIPKIYLLFSIILPRSLFKSWFLYSLLINISFSFMSIFAITAIVFKGQKHRTEATKFRYLWYQKWSIILGSGVLFFGFWVFFSWIQWLY